MTLITIRCIRQFTIVTLVLSSLCSAFAFFIPLDGSYSAIGTASSRSVHSSMLTGTSKDLTTQITPIPTKQLLLIRHGISLANEWMDREGNRWGDATFADPPTLTDARLSHRGEQQARDMATRLQDHHDWLQRVELVIVSPLTRTLQTMELGVLPCLSPSVPILAHHDMSERVYTASDTGRPVSELMKEFPHVDFGVVPSDHWWYHTSGKKVESLELVEEWRPFGQGQTYSVPGEPIDVFQERIERFRIWVASRPEKTIVMVSHWAILKEWAGIEFENCESRLVEWDYQNTHS
jgi:glucosyl-3-phosphoglycerate phosphatase